MTSTNGSNVNKNGHGTITDALTTLEEPTAPTPSVAIAYALGWAVGDALTCAKYKVFEHMVKVPDLDTPYHQWNLLVNQIISHCSRINKYLKSAKADFDFSAQMEIAASLLLGSHPGGVKTAVGAKHVTVAELHTGILTVLWSVDSPLARSYLLGHEMEQMCATPTVEQSTTVSTSVWAHNIEVHQLLTVLASKLPANAAHAVGYSLRLWSASLSAGGEESPGDLLRQGRRWHEALAGDVWGRDLLGPDDYVAVADGMTGRLWQTARQVAARFKVLLVGATLTGIGLLIWGTKGALGVGIATLLATFGLTWRVIGVFFGRVGARGEQQLWDTQIEWAIAYRFTVLRHPPSDRVLKPRSKQLAIDQPTKEHLRRYRQWKTNWPDVMTS